MRPSKFYGTLVLILVSVGPQCAEAQEPRNELTSQTRRQPASAPDPLSQLTIDQKNQRRKAVMILLDKAPVLDKPDKLEDDEFIQLTRALIMNRELKFDGVLDAVRALEDAIASVRNADATLKSNPDHNEVLYRRVVDRSAPWQSATTNTTVSLRPALYLFRCTDAKSKQSQEQTKNCSSNCTVEFIF